MTDVDHTSSRESVSPHPRAYLRGRILIEDALVDDGIFAYDAGRIVYAGAADGFDATGFALERRVPDTHLVMPGLVDIHCHGAHGSDFPSGDEAGARAAVDFLHRSGTTTLLASTVTASRERLLPTLGMLARLAAEGLIAGIHAEGPFLSTARCGAQNPAFLSAPDPGYIDELLTAGAGFLATMTYAPELDGATRLVDELTAHGVVPSLGHTDCDADTAADSLARARAALAPAARAHRGGASGSARRRPTVTHLFNGMPPMHHRSPGPVPVCLRAAAAGDAVVELVADNTHLDPQMVRSVFELVGSDNIALVTDSMAAAGLGPGSYTLGPSRVTVADGVATLDSTGSIAGGTATLLQVLARTVAAGVPLPEAAASVTHVPAAVLGLADELGRLQDGLRADAVIVDDRWRPNGVLRAGRWLDPLDE